MNKFRILFFPFSFHSLTRSHLEIILLIDRCLARGIRGPSIPASKVSNYQSTDPLVRVARGTGLLKC